MSAHTEATATAKPYVVKVQAANGRMVAMRAFESTDEAEAYAARFPVATEVVDTTQA